jgi:SpoVK/Ycf46/Vps4 family AAA+-type ATPase
MSVKYIIAGSNVHVVSLNEETALDELPQRIYAVRYDENMGFYLEITKDELVVPKKIYGDVYKRVEKCLKTYQDRTASTGILLTGDKGTGKTLLMSILANRVINELNMPVILVKEPYAGSDFTTFIEHIGECCLVLDEFGKMYQAHKHDEGVQQSALLSLMDGVDKTKRLIIITENREYDINEFILNRPSRVYYHFRYNKLDEKSITDYCEDFEVNAAMVEEIIELSRRSRIFSFDMLQTIVEEYLRFGSNIEEIITELNIEIREDAKSKLEILKVIERETGVEREVADSPYIFKPESYNHSRIALKANANSKKQKKRRGNGPLSARDEIEAMASGESSKDSENEIEAFYIEDTDLVYASGGKDVYETDKFTVIARTMFENTKDYSLLF